MESHRVIAGAFVVGDEGEMIAARGDGCAIEFGDAVHGHGETA
jgi:hypothetical protein